MKTTYPVLLQKFSSHTLRQ